MERKPWWEGRHEGVLCLSLSLSFSLSWLSDTNQERANDFPRKSQKSLNGGEMVWVRA